jgi:hypothetical protein
MEKKIFSKGHWIIIEGKVPAYFIYKLLRGKVSIHENGKMINVVDVTKGQKPVLLGIMAAIRKDRCHIASVKTESEVELEMLYINQLRSLIRYDVPESYRKSLDAMIETILLINRIKSLQSTFFEQERVDTKIPEGLTGEVSEVLRQLTRLYKESIHYEYNLILSKTG